ncbi:MAG: ATP-binding protein [Solibacillus sp.]
MMNELILPHSFEDVKSELEQGEQGVEKLAEVYEPVIDAESEILYVLSKIKSSGKLLLLKAAPGTGKSTFIQSLMWRSNKDLVGRIINIDMTSIDDCSKLQGLMREIQAYVRGQFSKENARNGMKDIIVIDYLESLDGLPEAEIKAFFVELNGILRRLPVLIIWPVTLAEDVEKIEQHVRNVSKTIFEHNHGVLSFLGPPMDMFSEITKKTIFLLNGGNHFSVFGLTDDDFEQALHELKAERDIKNRTLRDYMINVWDLWSKKQGYMEEYKKHLKKKTEIWTIFCYPTAEAQIDPFIRKSPNIVQDNWNINCSKLEEYTRNNQNEKKWSKDRLPLAINGYFTSKILYLPTHTLVSIISAYSKKNTFAQSFDCDELGVPTQWRTKSKAKQFLKNSPIYKQLNGNIDLGATRGKKTLDGTQKAFDYLNAVASSKVKGLSDKAMNILIADALRDVLTDNPDVLRVVGEEAHPQMPTVIPDIQIELVDKYICLEFRYSKNTEKNKIASYVLNKLDTYMRQIGQ